MSSVYDDIFNDSEMVERTLMFSKIAGITFDNRQIAARNCYKGMRLYLRREPHNRYDANAIAVCADCGLTQLGYIPRNTAETLAPMMDRNQKLNCYVEQVNVAPTGVIGINIRITLERSGM